MSQTIDNPTFSPRAISSDELGGMAQVVLYNDEVNDVRFVVSCLMQIFHHPHSLAVKIMKEAHEKGKAIAEVEEIKPATLHKQQLESFGLTAEVERI